MNIKKNINNFFIYFYKLISIKLSLKKALIRGFNLVEMLAAFTVFSLSILAILNIIYQAMNIETNTKNIDIALQNIRIIENYLKYSNPISFNQDGIEINNRNLINNNNEFVKLNLEPLNNLKFNKPELFERNITVNTLNDSIESPSNSSDYNKRVAVFTITLRWKEKGFYRKISIRSTISKDKR